ncbi:MAG: hypothetical protein IJQ85_10060, partial [Selenomonadaceae bacterium]|nr:hypothetical protein [Selenomonadaceae bacterium]
GLSNSPAGCVSILSFHLFFSPISKKWIVLSYLHNPFYTTAKVAIGCLVQLFVRTPDMIEYFLKDKIGIEADISVGVIGIGKALR